MRRLMAVLSAVALMATVGCDENEETEAAEPTTAEAAPSAVTSSLATDMVARFGGVLVSAQRLFVEVVPRADGQVQAHVYDAEGNELTGEATSKVLVKVQGQDAAQHDVELQWNPETKQFEGSVGADVRVAPGRVEVAVEQEGEETATGSVDEVAVAPEAQGGGTVVLAGSVASEVRVEADGAVHAVVLDPAGQPITGEAGVDVTVNVQGPEGEPKPVELAWNAELGHFVGEIEGSIQPGPVEVVIVRNGNSHRGRVEAVAVAHAPKAGGHVVVAGNHAVELVPADGKMHAIVVDARGRPVTGSANAQLTLNIGAGTNARELDLSWDAEADKWVADFEGELDLETTPVAVEVVTEGRRHRGRWNRGLALGHAHAAAGGRVGVEAPGAGVRVQAPGAAIKALQRGGIQVRTPSGDVQVQGPGAGARVRGPSGGVQVGGGASAMVKAGASAEAGAQAAAARREAEQARRRAEEARREAQGAAMGGVSIMAGGSLNVGN